MAVWNDQRMPVEDALTRLQQAAAVRTRAEEEAQAIRDRAAAEFADAVVYALTEGGMKPKEVAEATDVSYETIRRIARARDIERLREPTVTSRKKAGEPGQS